MTVDGTRISAADCQLHSHTWNVETAHLVTVWQAPARDLTITLHHRAYPEFGVLRKWVEISGRGLLSEVELETWAVAGAHGPRDAQIHEQVGLGPMGLGQPVFWNGFFLGIEHPGAENWVEADRIRCRFPCMLPLGHAPWTSPTCVLGAGPAGHEWEAFRTISIACARIVSRRSWRW